MAPTNKKIVISISIKPSACVWWYHTPNQNVAPAQSGCELIIKIILIIGWNVLIRRLVEILTIVLLGRGCRLFCRSRIIPRRVERVNLVSVSLVRRGENVTRGGPQAQPIAIDFISLHLIL